MSEQTGIPNSTQVPNVIIDEWMRELSDVELRILLLVVRQTLGYIVDRQSGKRKRIDWLTMSQIREKTGRTDQNTISRAISHLCELGLIEIHLPDGTLLDTAQKRQDAGRRHEQFLYSLGPAAFAPPREGAYRETLQAEGGLIGKPYKAYRETLHNKTKYLQNNNLGFSYENPNEGGMTDGNLTKVCEPADDPPSSPQKRPRTEAQRKYDVCLEAYQQIRGVQLAGKEFNLLRRELKLMFDSGRTPEQIIEFMKWCESQPPGSVWRHWTMFTIRKHIADFIAGRLQGMNNTLQSEIAMIMRRAQGHGKEEV